MRKICQICGKEFETTIPNKIYCSPECVKAAHKKQYTAYKNKLRPHFARQCKVCGAEFETSYPKKVYCSQDCYNKSRAPKLQVCPICGREFNPRANTSKYCSDECRRKGKAQLHKTYVKTHYPKPIIKKICVVCGAEFQTNRKCRVTCSHECSQKHNKNRTCVHIKICRNCGKEFEAVHGKRRYCSTKCRANFWYATKKAKHKAAVKATAEPEFKLTKKQIAQREYLKKRLRLRRLIAQDNIERCDIYVGN